jgi:aspartyl-tRNA(Asn)/glutamyl-tRNA(Gln) amidotransferase subunit A
MLQRCIQSRRYLHAHVTGYAGTAAFSHAASSLDALAERIRASQLLINAYITPFDAAAMRATIAAASTAESSHSPVLVSSAAAGLRVSLKDNFALAGHPTTAASRMLRNFIPHYSSAVADKLIRAGVVITGKTNMDEFGMG